MRVGPKDLEYISCLVGQIIVPFALMEASLNTIVEAAHNYYGGNMLEAMPRAFKKRKLYLQKCMRKLPIFAPVKDELKKLLDLAYRDSIIRNNVAHGFVSDFKKKPGILTFKQLRAPRNSETHVEEVARYSAKELTACGGRLFDTSIAMNAMAHRVVKLGMRQN